MSFGVILYLSVFCLCVLMYIMCLVLIEAIWTLKPELQWMIVNHHVGAGNQTLSSEKAASTLIGWTINPASDLQVSLETFSWLHLEFCDKSCVITTLGVLVFLPKCCKFKTWINLKGRLYLKSGSLLILVWGLGNLKVQKAQRSCLSAGIAFKKWQLFSIHSEKNRPFPAKGWYFKSS